MEGQTSEDTAETQQRHSRDTFKSTHTYNTVKGSGVSSRTRGSSVWWCVVSHHMNSIRILHISTIHHLQLKFQKRQKLRHRGETL